MDWLSFYTGLVSGAFLIVIATLVFALMAKGRK